MSSFNRRVTRLRKVLILGGIIFVSVLLARDASIYLMTLFPGKSLWDYLDVFVIPTFSALSVALLVFWLEATARTREKIMTEDRNKQLEQERSEETVQRYFDRITETLLDDGVAACLLADVPTRDNMLQAPRMAARRSLVRARTLSALRGLAHDGERKGAVIMFLLETGLIEGLLISLEGAELYGLSLESVDLRSIQLERASLALARLTEVDLSHSNLSEANMMFSNLYKSKFISSILAGCNLNNANLHFTDLRNADLSEASLLGADLTFSNLEGAVLTGVKWDKSTKWPLKWLLGEEMPSQLPSDLDI